jgi:hypothetical protein
MRSCWRATISLLLSRIQCATHWSRHDGSGVRLEVAVLVDLSFPFPHPPSPCPICSKSAFDQPSSLNNGCNTTRKNSSRPQTARRGRGGSRQDDYADQSACQRRLAEAPCGGGTPAAPASDLVRPRVLRRRLRPGHEGLLDDGAQHCRSMGSGRAGACKISDLPRGFGALSTY